MPRTGVVLHKFCDRHPAPWERCDLAFGFSHKIGQRGETLALQYGCGCTNVRAHALICRHVGGLLLSMIESNYLNAQQYMTNGATLRLRCEALNMGHELGSHGRNCVCPACEVERTQLRAAIERIKKVLPRVTDAEQAEATRRDLRKIEQRYELISPINRPKTPYRNQYRCPYGEKNCGENTKYCTQCNKDYEQFRWTLNDER
jgi:hypothetical protein